MDLSWEEEEMPAFLKEIEKFRGTGETNQAGQSLEEFLKEYDPKRYENPSNTVDNVVFSWSGSSLTQVEDGLELLLIKRGNHPCIGRWALPGGFVNLGEGLEEAAKRELFEETGVMDLEAEQVGTFGSPDRDPRARIITTVYLALVKKENTAVRSGDDASDAAWFQLSLRLERVTESEEKREKIYELLLANEEKSEKLRAEVMVSERKKHILKIQDYKLLDAGEISADHAVLILNALLHLKKKLKEWQEDTGSA